ncbi:MAG: helix-turn-helix transcriptional regulator [Desulfuromonadales bacterium]|jgi:transcriptional regulator with XRE-family HTH domain
MSRFFQEDGVSTVCIDAKAVKRIREEMQLTQLYVSKVVGVTTDTISRWENNRYPTIRRENALKLAEALEVALDEILLKPTPDATASAASAAGAKSPLVWIVLTLLLLAGAVVLGSLIAPSPTLPVAVTAERWLPDYAAPGSRIPVQIRLTYRTETSGVILREYFPKDWKIVQANPPASSLDNVHGIARWIIKAGDARDRVVYLVQVDAAAKRDTIETFQGEIVASREGNQSAVPVQGVSSIKVAPVHWVDSNGDGRIDDVEMLEGSYTIEDMAGVHIDWNALEELWAAGRYAWDAQQGRFVARPENP